MCTTRPNMIADAHELTIRFSDLIHKIKLLMYEIIIYIGKTSTNMVIAINRRKILKNIIT